VLAIAGLVGGDATSATTAYPAMRWTTWFVIMPLAFACLLVGLLESVGTSWGLLRHYWVVWKLAITLAAVAVLLLQLGVINYLANAASGRPLGGDELVQEKMTLVAHGAGGLLGS
jgi:hypothetical protein